MIDTPSFAPRFYDPLMHYFWRFAASGALPGKWFRDQFPSQEERKACTGTVDLEIVSHCWQYSNLLAYQLSSLVSFPPSNARVTMTVFYSKDDERTVKLLDYFTQIDVANVRWHWQELDKYELFRRGIGRNRAAYSSSADWIWFTDCDVIFHGNCIDEVCEALLGRTDVLVYPKQERITPMLAEDDPMLSTSASPQIVTIDGSEFSLHKVTRATGPLQIVHGDVARAVGYCGRIAHFQTRSQRWRKTYEDSAFRWLLGTEGVPLDVEGSCRIRHVHKGRYRQGSQWSQLRSKIRQAQEY